MLLWIAAKLDGPPQSCTAGGIQFCWRRGRHPILLQPRVPGGEENTPFTVMIDYTGYNNYTMWFNIMMARDEPLVYTTEMADCWKRFKKYKCCGWRWLKPYAWIIRAGSRG